MLSYFRAMKRQAFSPIHLYPGDSLRVTWRDEHNNETVLCDKTIDAEHAMTVTEAVLFEVTYEGRRALGGMVLEQEHNQREQRLMASAQRVAQDSKRFVDTVKTATRRNYYITEQDGKEIRRVAQGDSYDHWDSQERIVSQPDRIRLDLSLEEAQEVRDLVGASCFSTRRNDIYVALNNTLLSPNPGTDLSAQKAAEEGYARDLMAKATAGCAKSIEPLYR